MTLEREASEASLVWKGFLGNEWVKVGAERCVGLNQMRVDEEVFLSPSFPSLSPG